MGKSVPTPTITLHYSNEEVYLLLNDVGGHYAYINDSVIGNKSLLHKFLWKVHGLYDKDKGTYYNVGVSLEDAAKAREIIKELIEANKK